MSIIDDEIVDSPNDTGEDTELEESVEDDSIEDTEPDDTSDDKDSDDVEKLKEQNKKLFERAKKAEGFVQDKDGNWVKKEPKKPASPKQEKKEAELSAKDAIVLMKAEVDNDEDIDEVVRYAKFENISIAKALESNVIKNILAERKEERKTAEATHTGGGKKGATEVSGEDLLANANKGDYPDDPTKLAEAAMEEKYK